MSRSVLSGRFSIVVAVVTLTGLAACSDVPSAVPSIGPAASAALSRTSGDEPVVAGEVMVKMRDGGSVETLAAQAMARRERLDAAAVAHLDHHLTRDDRLVAARARERRGRRGRSEDVV